MKLPKIVQDQLSGNPLEWSEGSGRFLATTDESGAADSMKMNFLTTSVTG